MKVLFGFNCVFELRYDGKSFGLEERLEAVEAMEISFGALECFFCLFEDGKNEEIMWEG